MQKQILQYILIVLTFLFSFFAFRSVDQAINVPESSAWLVPGVWFSLVYISWTMAVLLTKRKYLSEIMSAVILLLSLFFVPQNGEIIWHFLFIILAWMIISLSIYRIRSNLALSIKINIWRSARAGSSTLVIALALVIASQYYFEVKNYPGDKLLPALKMEGIANMAIEYILPKINAGFGNLPKGDLTVDQLILATQKEQIEQNGLTLQTKGQVEEMIARQFGSNVALDKKDELVGSYMDTMKESSENLLLEEGRKRLGEIAGISLTGEEKAGDVMSQLVNKKISDYTSPSLSGVKELSALPLIMAIALFFTIVSLGTFLSYICMVFLSAIFFILTKVNLVRIEHVPVEMEVIG